MSTRNEYKNRKNGNHGRKVAAVRIVKNPWARKRTPKPPKGGTKYPGGLFE